MTKIVSGVVAAIIVGCLGLPVLLASTILDGAAAACATNWLSSPPSQPVEAVTRFDADQVGIAATIVEIGVTKGVPRWGWVVALATAMQESGLRNLPNLGVYNDHDSIGVFQQRPSQGWGMPNQLADPAYQAARFYDKLLTVPGWHNMSLTQAAQAVQISAYPDAYAKWTDAAVGLVEHLATTGPVCATDTLTTLPDGFTLPGITPPAVAAAILWALGQLGTPYSFGGDCTAPHSGDPARQCDCSSLMQQAYRAAGIAIPRVTTDQAKAGTPIADPSLLLPGDLILIPGSLGSMTNPRHVGMYLGNGLIVQAPQSNDVVKISALSGWLEEVAAIRRIVKADY